MKKLFVTLGFLFALHLSSACAESVAILEIDTALTAAAPWKVGDVIPNSEKKIYGGNMFYINCQFLGVAKNGYYLVQEWYKDGTKSTEPFQISVSDELKKTGFVCSDQAIYSTLTRWFIGGKQKFWEEKYENGEKNGSSIEWTESGKKISEEEYKNGLRDGVWIVWDSTTGNKIKEIYYNAGQENGSWLEWHENGQKKIESFYKTGELDGLWQEWSSSGQLLNKGHYTNGLKEGEWFETSEQSGVKSRGAYKNGQKNGLWHFYYSNGRKAAEGHYKNDLQEGKWKTWHSETDMTYEGNYKAGRQVGIWTETYSNSDGVVVNKFNMDEE